MEFQGILFNKAERSSIKIYIDLLPEKTIRKPLEYKISQGISCLSPKWFIEKILLFKVFKSDRRLLSKSIATINQVLCLFRIT